MLLPLKRFTSVLTLISDVTKHKISSARGFHKRKECVYGRCFFVRDRAGRDMRSSCSLLSNVVHHPADIGHASPALWIAGSTLTRPLLLLSLDSFHDGGRAVFLDVFYDVIFSIVKTVTDFLRHDVVPLSSSRRKGQKNMKAIIKKRAG